MVGVSGGPGGAVVEGGPSGARVGGIEVTRVGTRGLVGRDPGVRPPAPRASRGTRRWHPEKHAVGTPNIQQLNALLLNTLRQSTPDIHGGTPVNWGEILPALRC